MQFTVTELDYRKLKPLLERAGLGLDESLNGREDVVSVELWTSNNAEGLEPGPSGFTCGRVTREFGSFPKFTLMLDDSRLNRGRLHGLLTDLLNEFARG